MEPSNFSSSKPANRIAFASAFVSALIMAALFAKIGVFPFGNLTLLMSDLDSIYAEFFSELRLVFLGKADPFYSFHAGIGMNTLAMYVFYCSSPFNLILAAIPEAYFLDGITLLTILKIAAAAFTMTFFLLRRCRNGMLRDFWAFLFGVCYALSAYAVGYSFSLIWLDGMIFLPLVTAAIDRLVAQDRIARLILAYALLFLSGFYIGYMAGLFSAIYFAARLIARPEAERLRRSAFRLCLKFVFAVLIAAAMNMALILPTAYVLANNMGLFGQSAPGFGVLFELIDLPWKAFNGAFDGYKDSLPFLYAGLLPLLTAAVFFSSRSISAKRKAIGGFILLFLILAFHLAPLNFIWHAFDHPSWFPFRYAFVFPFALIWLAAVGITARNGAADNTASGITFWAAGLIGYLVIMMKLAPERVGAEFFYRNLTLILLIGACVPAIRTAPDRGFLKFALALIVIADLGFNAFSTLSRYQAQYTIRGDYKRFRDRYDLDLIERHPKNGEFYRIETDSVRTYNDGMALGIPGIGQFSSVSSVAQTALLKNLGYDCYATWCLYRGENPFADSLLGIRYLLGDRNQKIYAPVSTTVGENRDAFPLVFWIGDPSSFPIANADGPIRYHQSFAQAIDAEAGELYEAVSVPSGKAANLSRDASDPNGERWLKIDSEAEAEMSYAIRLRQEGIYLICLPNISLNYDVEINGEPKYSALESVTPFLSAVSAEANETLTIDFHIKNTAEYIDDVQIYRLNRTALSELSETVRESAPKFTFDGRRSFTIQLEAADTARTLMTTIPFDRGWNVTLGNAAIEPIAVEGFLAVPIPAGRGGVLRLTFEPPLLWLGTVISLSGGLIFIIIAIVSAARRKPAYYESAEPAIDEPS